MGAGNVAAGSGDGATALTGGTAPELALAAGVAEGAAAEPELRTGLGDLSTKRPPSEAAGERGGGVTGPSGGLRSTRTGGAEAGFAVPRANGVAGGAAGVAGVTRRLGEETAGAAGTGAADAEGRTARVAAAAAARARAASPAAHAAEKNQRNRRNRRNKRNGRRGSQHNRHNRSHRRGQGHQTRRRQQQR
jgi:hypothetical protein